MNAPPTTTGFVGIAGGPPPTTPTPVAGINIWLNLAQLGPLIPVTTNTLGAASVTVAIPPGTTGARVHTQMVFFNTAGCGGLNTFSASNALDVTIQ